MRHFVQLILLTVCLSVCSCAEETSVYPPVLTEFTNLRADQSGCMHTLLKDDGTVYAVQNATSHTGFTPDSTYRVVALYELVQSTTSTVHLYDFIRTISPRPVSNWKNEIKQDPVKVQSIWVKGDFLNLVLLVKAQNNPHAFRFIEASDGSILKLTFYHDKGKDIEAYTQRAYLSVPLAQYKSHFQQLQFSINTEQEMKVYTFEF